MTISTADRSRLGLSLMAHNPHAKHSGSAKALYVCFGIWVTASCVYVIVKKYSKIKNSIQIPGDDSEAFIMTQHANSDGGRMSEPQRGEFAQEPERINACESSKTKLVTGTVCCFIFLM